MISWAMPAAMVVIDARDSERLSLVSLRISSVISFTTISVRVDSPIGILWKETLTILISSPCWNAKSFGSGFSLPESTSIRNVFASLSIIASSIDLPSLIRPLLSDGSRSDTDLDARSTLWSPPTRICPSGRESKMPLSSLFSSRASVTRRMISSSGTEEKSSRTFLRSLSDICNLPERKIERVPDAHIISIGRIERRGKRSPYQSSTARGNLPR